MPILDAWYHDEPVTQEFFYSLQIALALNYRIKLGNLYVNAMIVADPDDIVVTICYLNYDLEFKAYSVFYTVRQSNFMVEELIKPLLFATESELDEIKNRLSALEGKA